MSEISTIAGYIEAVAGVSNVWFEYLERSGAFIPNLVIEVDFDTTPGGSQFGDLKALERTIKEIGRSHPTLNDYSLRIVPMGTRR